MSFPTSINASIASCTCNHTHDIKNITSTHTRRHIAEEKETHWILDMYEFRNIYNIHGNVQVKATKAPHYITSHHIISHRITSCMHVYPHLLWGVRGRELHSDSGLALGDHRIGETDHVNALLQHGIREVRSQTSVTQHHLCRNKTVTD